MKKLMKKTIHIEHVILPILTLLMLAGFIGSLIFPKEVLDTIKVNVTEEEGDTEYRIALSDTEVISYEMNTAGSPMKGIQVGISKEGVSQEGVMLRYQVYEHKPGEEDRFGELLSDNTYEIAKGDEVQYVYLPFANNEKCLGDIIICFACESGQAVEKAPTLLFNHSVIDNTITRKGEEVLDGTLKSMYIYTHDTYPLLYDFRLMTFVFLAVSMTVSYPKRKRKGKENER